MSIYYCNNCDAYHDNDYIVCNEDVTVCEESEQELEIEKPATGGVLFDRWFDSLSDDPNILELLEKL
jgi:hypothetical protein